MSLSYAESLSYFPHKGKVGMPELSEKSEDLQNKLEQLEQMIRQSRHTVVITGAGISTSAGIPDFRGPNGVWTLEKRGEKPSFNKGFDQAQPTYTHRALCTLEQNNYVHFVISQNIDGLHHRSGLALNKLAELHGNVYSEECEVCHTQVIRPTCVGSYCRKRTGNVCNARRGRNKDLKCRGKLRDTVLDWEDPLPELALQLSEQNCSQADLCLCLGTSLQIRPCRDLPRKTKKNGGRVVIVNLQKTTMDSIASLIIHERCDQVMNYIMEKLNLHIDEPKIKTDLSPYAHIKRVILLCGESFSDRNGIAEKLAIDLQSLALHLNEFHPEQDTKEEKKLEKCQRLMESSKFNSSTHSTCIIDGITCQAEIDFFRNYFSDRLILCRYQIIKPDSNSSFDSNTSWLFTFSSQSEENLDEQIKTFLKLVRE